MESTWSFDDEQPVAVVIDNGSSLIKAGFSGDDAPRAIFPSTLENCQGTSVGGHGDCYSQNFVDQSLIDRGIFRSTDGMQALWHQVFDKELRTSPKEHPLLLSEPIFNEKSVRENMVQVAFEAFRSPGVYIASQAVLSMFSSGRVTGLVLESGDGITQAVPVYEGSAIPHASNCIDVGGKDVTEHMVSLLKKRGYTFTDVERRCACRSLKERQCYIAIDVNRELEEGGDSTKIDRTFELPDGRNIVVRNERFLAPEILFNPSVIGKDFQTIPSMLSNCLSKCDVDIQEELHRNVVLTGGNTMFPYFREKTELAMKEDVQPYFKLNILAPSDRKLYAWTGGSILASLSTMIDMWISEEEYLEHGSHIVHRKCY